MELVVDRLRERRAEHRGRGGENQLRVIAATRLADRFQQRARAVEIDPVALVEIGFRLAGDDGGEVEDHVRAAGDHRLGLSRRGQIRRDRLDLSGESRRRGGLDDVDQHELCDRFPVERLVANEPLGELATDHPGRADDQHLHVTPPFRYRASDF